MRILSITLADVRRFTDTVTVAGLDRGVNVLTAPNESGKSTLFDALQAVFFTQHRAKSKEAKALQPHAGGAPMVSVEVALPEGRFRITKRWLKQPLAEVREGARLIAKGDAAEDWIAARVKPDEAGGPAGLLWVRQGITALDSDTGKAADQARGVRRDLLSSVAGEVEAMTGGRRMDLARARCLEELGALVTSGGRSKAGGPLKAAEDEVAALELREANLDAVSRQLSEAIRERRGLRREAQELRDPEAVARAEAAVETAGKALDAARQHADLVTQARARVVAAERDRAHAAERLDALARQAAQRDETAERAKSATAEEETTRATLAAREAAAVTAAQAVDAARAALGTAETTLAAVRAAEKASQDRKRREALEGTLAQARALARTIAQAGLAAREGPDAETMARLDETLHALRVQEALRDQAAMRVTMRYAGPDAPRVTLADGSPLVDGVARPLPDGGELTLDGIGRLVIAPGARAEGAGDFATVKAAFDAALSATGGASVEAARNLARTRRTAEEELRTARAAQAALVPDGIDALEAELALLLRDLETAPAAPCDLPDVETAGKAVEAAARVLAEAVAGADACTTAQQAARVDHAKAMARREAAEDRAAEAAAALGQTDVEADLTARREALAAAEAEVKRQVGVVTRLSADAPDAEAAEAAFNRARSAVTAAGERGKALDRRLAELDTLIELRAGEGVDEDLAEVRDRLAAAIARRDRLTFERDMLTLLRDTLDEARGAARDHYFEPVTRELRPLLHVLWPDAELVFDDETILPTALIRDGRSEALDDLSGGTREQIALLVRLAFARLLAKSDRAAPVILDDALVYTDDDRIERMFDTLHRQAGDMQLIVFSCRQRAFRALGGNVLGFEAGRPPNGLDD